jgi:hypothetical protein
MPLPHLLATWCPQLDPPPPLYSLLATGPFKTGAAASRTLSFPSPFLLFPGRVSTPDTRLNLQSDAGDRSTTGDNKFGATGAAFPAPRCELTPRAVSFKSRGASPLPSSSELQEHPEPPPTPIVAPRLWNIIASLPPSHLTADDPFSVSLVPRDHARRLTGTSPVLVDNTLPPSSHHQTISKRHHTATCADYER